MLQTLFESIFNLKIIQTFRTNIHGVTHLQATGSLYTLETHFTVHTNLERDNYSNEWRNGNIAKMLEYSIRELHVRRMKSHSNLLSKFCLYLPFQCDEKTLFWREKHEKVDSGSKKDHKMPWGKSFFIMNCWHFYSLRRYLNEMSNTKIRRGRDMAQTQLTECMLEIQNVVECRSLN